MGVRACAALSLVLTSGMAIAAPPPIVETTAGPVQGVDTPDGPRWFGVPFGVPPLGDLRWRPTVPATSWDAWPERLDDEGVLQADALGSACLQPWEDGPYGSEDCLYLNVFAPPDAQGAPVFVHIHGGANFWGWGEDDATGFTRHGVVVVTMNYRLGMMGLLAHPALTDEGGGTSSNYHAWDQIAALRWVRDNIAAFGGDPDNVTLGGFSAGAGNTLALVASPEAAGLFARATVLAVGDAWVTGTNMHSLALREWIGERIAARLGCADDVADVPACLRALPAERIMDEWGGDDWGPTVDGVILPRPAIDQIVVNGGTVPLIIGFNREETASFIMGDVPDPLSWNEYVIGSNDLKPAKLATAARKLFTESAYGSLRWAFLMMTVASVHGCPTRRVALATRNTTYRYLHTHVLENYAWAQEARAYHGAEYDLLWWADTMDLTDEERALSETLRRYWTNFMWSGDPNGEGLVTWPEYEPASERILVTDTTMSEVSAYHARECAILDQAPVYPTCNTAWCRKFMSQVLGTPGWWADWGWFPDETRQPPPPRPPE